jgi:hypothetical protein
VWILSRELFTGGILAEICPPTIFFVDLIRLPKKKKNGQISLGIKLIGENLFSLGISNIEREL